MARFLSSWKYLMARVGERYLLQRDYSPRSGASQFDETFIGIDSTLKQRSSRYHRAGDVTSSKREGAMKLLRRQFLQPAACAAALPAVSRIARRPVRIIVGFPAGGAGDIVARLIGQ
jgi:hypothetical protein